MELIDELERSGTELMDKSHLLASDLSDSSLWNDTVNEV
jgi:hypothetical protein